MFEVVSSRYAFDVALVPLLQQGEGGVGRHDVLRLRGRCDILRGRGADQSEARGGGAKRQEPATRLLRPASEAFSLAKPAHRWRPFLEVAEYR
jgi:hypothetical protein